MSGDRIPLFSRAAIRRLILPLIVEQFLAVTVGMADTAVSYTHLDVYKRQYGAMAAGMDSAVAAPVGIKVAAKAGTAITRSKSRTALEAGDLTPVSNDVLTKDEMCIRDRGNKEESERR